MTDQEKEALLKFIGVTHAAAKQTDLMIIGSPKDIQRVSDKLSRQFEETLKVPTQNYTAQNYPIDNGYIPNQLDQAPAQQNQVKESIPFIESINETFIEPELYPSINLKPQQDSVSVSGTLHIVEQLKIINLNLEKIASILTKNNVKAKPKNTIKN